MTFHLTVLVTVCLSSDCPFVYIKYLVRRWFVLKRNGWCVWMWQTHIEGGRDVILQPRSSSQPMYLIWKYELKINKTEWNNLRIYGKNYWNWYGWGFSAFMRSSFNNLVLLHHFLGNKFMASRFGPPRWLGRLAKRFRWNLFIEGDGWKLARNQLASVHLPGNIVKLENDGLKVLGYLIIFSAI